MRKRIVYTVMCMMSATILNAQTLTDWHCHNIMHDYLAALAKQSSAESDADSMLIRISEIEVYPEYLDEYLAFAKTVGAESVDKAPGVICIYPMVQKRDRSQIRILEIYRDQAAYQHHIKTPHFQTYKQGTLHMVKSLDLVDMRPMNAAGMKAIFQKMK